MIQLGSGHEIERATTCFLNNMGDILGSILASILGSILASILVPKLVSVMTLRQFCGKRILYRMRGLSLLINKERLISMFMTGAGGSGKSHVINNILAYASRFCDAIDQPFDKRTIVVAARTGVAATSVLGETAHSAMCLNVSGGVQAKLHNQKSHDIIDQRAKMLDFLL
jgi:hypothetical protein